MYHKVSEGREWGLTTTTPTQFKAQVEALAHLGFTFSRIQEYKTAEDQIFMTFDDGYACIKEHAAPILDAIGGVATVFAITNYVGKKNSWDYFSESKQVDHMNWSELRELHEMGWEIGSHGCSHRRLLNLDDKNIKQELRTSKKELEDKLGAQVTTFCPPFNAWNSDLLSQIEQAGYTRVAISYPLNGLPKWSGMFIPRLGVYLHDALPLFLGKIFANPFSPIQVLQQQLINLAGDGNILENWLKPPLR